MPKEADDEEMEYDEAQGPSEIKVTNRDIPLELPLPSSMETLCILRKSLDQNINFLYTRAMTPSF